MANNISTRISLQDGMSGPLQKINAQLGKVTSGMRGVQNSSAGMTVTTGDAKSAMVGLGTAASNSCLQMAKSMAKAMTGVNLLSGVISNFANPRKLIALSDEFAGLSARVAMVNDGLQSNEALTQKIFNAANASRSSYKDMAGLVARIGSNAKDAFTSNDEMIAFAEQLNKQFVIGGASAEEMSAATLQLSQALASGTLRGDEFNSIAEQAPTIIGAVSKYLGVMPGQVRALAAEGQITADVVKKAVLAASGETNKAFEQMPKTFSQSWTEFTNQTLNKTKGLLTKINELGNSKTGTKLFEGLTKGVDSLVKTVTPILNTLLYTLNDPEIAESVGNYAKNLLKIAPAMVSIGAGLPFLMKAISLSGAIGKGMGAGIFNIFGGGEALGVAQHLSEALLGIRGNALNATAGLSALKDVVSTSSPFISSFKFGGFDTSGILETVSNLGPMMKGVLLPSLGSLVTSIGSFAAPISLAFAGLFGAGAIGGGALVGLGLIRDRFGDTINEMLLKARLDGPKMIEGFASGMVQKIPVLITQGKYLVMSFLETATTLLPSVFNTGGQIIYSLASGLGQALPQLIPAAAGVITGLLTGLVTNLPMILAGGMQMVLGLVQGLMDSLPALIDSIPTMIEGFVNGIGTYLPTILETGVKIVFTIAVGLINAIPHIVAAIPSIITAIWNGITSINWLDLGAQIVNGIIQGIKSMLGAIGDAVGSIGQSALDGVKNALGIHSPSKVFDRQVGRMIPPGLVEGVKYALPQAISDIKGAFAALADMNAPTIIPTIAPEVTTAAAPAQAMPTVGQSVPAGPSEALYGVTTAMDTYQATVESKQAQTHAFTTADSVLQAQQMTAAYQMMPVGVNAAMTGVYNAVVVGMTQVNGFIAQMPALYYGFGVSMMQGLNGGLASQIGAVVDTTNNLVAAVKNAFISGLGIHSPSRVTYDFGHYTGEGFIRGLSNTQLVAFVRKIVGDMKSAFGKGKIDLDALVSYLQGDSTKLADWMDEFDGGSYVKGVPGSGKGDKALKFFLGMVNDNSYGYSFGGHGPKDFDCASSISWALRTAGFDMGGGWDTTGVANALFALGWQKVPNNGNPQRGDIVMNEANHVEWALGGGQLAGFHSNYDGVSGDSSGTEASVGAYYDYPWDYYIRYPAGGFGMDGTSMSEAIREAYRRVALGIVDMGGTGNMNALGDYGSAIGGAARWADVVRQALRLTGQSEQYVGDILWCIENESGGNPYAINNWDSNAAMGDPSRGLMQTIGSTFNAYRLPNLSADIYDPLSNIVAGIRYMLSRYGSIEAVVGPRRQSWYGYAEGTTNARKGWAWVGENGPELMYFGGGETVLNNHDSMAAIREAANNGSAPASGSSSGYGLSNVVININMDNVNIASDMDIENVATQLGQYLKEELTYQPLGYHGG